MLDELSNSICIVVGGAGFVGSNLCHRLLQSDMAELVIVDNLISAEAANIPQDARVRFVHGSITDDVVLSALPASPKYCFQLAAYHGNQSSIANPLADHQNGTLSTLRFFEWLHTRDSLCKVVYSAAGCAVAEKTFDDACATEEDAPVSLYHDSPYSISKLAGELYGNYYFRQHGLPLVKARFQNVYGPREILGAGQWRGTVNTVWRNVTPTFIYKALCHEALPLENGGNNSRDFIFVEDIVEGLLRCALKGVPGDVYNLASGQETTIRALATVINELTENPTAVEMHPARDWDTSGRRFGSTEKAEREIGFKAQMNIEDGLQHTVDWTRQHMDLVTRCIDRHEYFMSAAATGA